MAVSSLDENPGSERLNSELRIVPDVSDIGVLIPLELRIFLETIDGCQTNDTLVRRLEEVDHAEQRQHIDIGLAQDALAVCLTTDMSIV